MIYLGLTVALAACSKNSQETDALSPPPRDTVRTSTPASKKPAADTTQVRMERPDTSQYGKDSTRAGTDSTK
jgi:hypothetical protein